MDGGQVAGGGEYGVDVRVGSQKLGLSGTVLDPDLFNCTFGALGVKRMIKKAPHTVPPSEYALLRGLRNLTMIAVDHFFIAGGDGGLVGNGYLVLESVDESFKLWVQGSERTQLFLDSSPGKVKLSPLLRTMVLELVGLVDALIGKDCFPAGLRIENLFIKNMFQGGRPKLKILMDYNVIRIRSGRDIESAMAAIKGIVDYCCQIHGVVLDDISTSFRDFIGYHTSALDLERYPDTWSDEEKICYIMMIISGDLATMSACIDASNVTWPWDPTFTRTKKAIPILEEIRNHHINPPKSTKKSKSSKQQKPAKQLKSAYRYDAWAYIQLCRNVLKSFQIPDNRKADIPNRRAFLRLMEKWNQGMWVSLYRQIGPLEGDKI